MAALKTIDEELMVYYREAVASGKQFQGLNVLQYAKPIRKMIKQTGAKRLLDYGSGLGHQYTIKGLHKQWGVPMPILYDPAVEDFKEKPRGIFDGVICSDVVEHVPEPLIDALIQELFAYATKFVFVSTCCRPAKKSFPDGRNMHVTIRPAEWWRAKLKAFAGMKRFEMVVTP